MVLSLKTRAQSAARLQSAFHTFQLALRVVLNAEKTLASTLNHPAIKTLNGTNITLADSYKYLGIWLDSRLSFKSHNQYLPQELKIKLGFSYRIKARLSIVQSNFVRLHRRSNSLYHSALCVQNFTLIVHCNTQLDGLRYDLEETADSCYFFIKLYC